MFDSVTVVDGYVGGGGDDGDPSLLFITCTFFFIAYQAVGLTLSAPSIFSVISTGLMHALIHHPFLNVGGACTPWLVLHAYIRLT